MPTSYFTQVSDVIELITLVNPQSLLDVGVGFGKYGFLSREYLEFYDGRDKYDDWKRRIDGIEVFEGYITPVHKFIYNNIYTGDALELLPKLEVKYDLILLIDIIEHFSHEKGMQLIKECLKRGRNVIISTPKDTLSQDKVFGNQYEKHEFCWRKRHFLSLADRFFISKDYSLICFIGEDACRVKKGIVKSRLRRCFPFIRKPYAVIKKLLGKRS